MTPESLVRKYKEDITSHFGSEERGILEAYISSEVKRRVDKKEKTWKFIDNALYILFIATIVVIAGLFLILLFNISSWDNADLEARKEFYREHYQIQVEYLEDKVKKLEKSAEEHQAISKHYQDLLDEKNLYCGE